MTNPDPTDINRRKFLQLGAMGVAASTALGAPPARAKSHDDGELHRRAPFPELEEKTIFELQTEMTSRGLTSRRLTRMYIQRIRALDGRLNSVLEINPDALTIASALDLERRHSGPRGPLHGIPILLKDNIGTNDGMETTAGSLALLGFPPAEDATVAAKLRAAGAVILGKTALSEWANFRSTQSSSGWNGRGGQSRNPYALDRNPCGSSSGVPVSANLSAASLGTETDGSIVCPATANGIVGIKPTVGLTSRFNVIPISATQDTVGPHGRTVADAAAVLGALTGIDPKDPATIKSAGEFFDDYTPFLDPAALMGARIGVPRDQAIASPETAAIFEEALQAIRDAGATVVDDLSLGVGFSNDELEVLLFEFKAGINEYLSRLGPGAPADLAALIAFNEANADRELRFFGQEIFELAQARGPLTDPTYTAALAASVGEAVAAFDELFDTHDLDALAAPTGSPAWTTDLINGDHFLGGTSSAAARAGYPLVSVPAGFSFGLPVNITFMGRAFDEPTLIALASSFEAATNVRRPPKFLRTLPLEG